MVTVGKGVKWRGINELYFSVFGLQELPATLCVRDQLYYTLLSMNEQWFVTFQ